MSFIPTPEELIVEPEPLGQYEQLLCTCGHMLIAHRADENVDHTRCMCPVVQDDGSIMMCPCEHIELNGDKNASNS